MKCLEPVPEQLVQPSTWQPRNTIVRNALREIQNKAVAVSARSQEALAQASKAMTLSVAAAGGDHEEAIDEAVKVEIERTPMKTPAPRHQRV